MEFWIKEVKTADRTVVSVANLRGGSSYIVVDKGCWALGNTDDKGTVVLSPWLFPEAVAALKQLPNKPSDFKPYTNFVSAKEGGWW